MNTKVTVSDVNVLEKFSFYTNVENKVVDLFSKLFPESRCKHEIDVVDARQLDILNRELNLLILQIGEEKSVQLPLDYVNNLQSHFMNRIVCYAGYDILSMNSLFTVQFMTHYQMYRYLSEWILAKLNLFVGMSSSTFSKEVLTHAKMINNILHTSLNDKAVIEISLKVAHDYFQDVVDHTPPKDAASIRLLVPSATDTTFNTNHKISGLNADYINWAFKAAMHNNCIQFIEQRLIQNKLNFDDLDAIAFYMQEFLDDQYYCLPIKTQAAYNRRFVLATHMIISESARLNKSRYMTILSPEGGYSKLKSKNIPSFLYLRCKDESLLDSYKNPKNVVFRDMLRLKLVEFNFIRQSALDAKLLKKHYDETLRMLVDPNFVIEIPQVSVQPDLSTLTSILKSIRA